MTRPETNNTSAAGTGPLMLDGADAARQSLATGAAGIALLHLERALIGSGSWPDAHSRIREAATGALDGGQHTGLYYGTPAIAFLLNCAAKADSRYAASAATLDQHVTHLTQRRLTTATARIKHGVAASLREYDLFYGLTGIGALLMQRLPASDTLADLLRYLTVLVRPYQHDDFVLPGWWAAHDPDPTLPTPGGHANLGMAHGAAGILALLALAMRHGHVVEDHAEAIDQLTRWFDRWRQHDAEGSTWWPQWLTLENLRTGRASQPKPGRPSWCYGTPGIARALQLAAIATDDPTRRADAENALAACLTDSHVDRLTDLGLCHGLAGLYATAQQATADAQSPALKQRLPALASAIQTAAHNRDQDGDAGLLTGHAGIHLAAETARHGTTNSGWGTCLLIV
ncbi:lanthionine synthetase C family protein [Micromonospora sp. WMMD1155]|uniref:lanthionine synthetase C family protein n=1 Tax=Micromonospora sp. WMMD1155 TaxID=3016094 RepID=UPI002499C0A0|nr:lanthionine synthetase C family protein [Micromonospora sp. WMMD1155]WFE53030.1 lanthionine synthetase C family protein [Micromonospora sp. WMMD1155]